MQITCDKHLNHSQHQYTFGASGRTLMNMELTEVCRAIERLVERLVKTAAVRHATVGCLFVVNLQGVVVVAVLNHLIKVIQFLEELGDVVRLRHCLHNLQTSVNGGRIQSEKKTVWGILTGSLST